MAADLHQASPSFAPSPPPSASSSEDIEMDEFTAELTRRMAHYMLQEDEDELPLHYRSGSDYGGGFMGGETSWSSAESSPTSVWSPPVTPAMKTEVDGAAESLPNHLINRFESMDLSQKGLKFHDRHSSSNNRAPALLSAHRPNMAMLQNTEPRRRQFDRATPATKTEHRTGGRCHQRTRHVSGSGMQAVFLGGPGSRSRSSGTGVFLPRGAGSSTESRKQPRCSTVLIPTRVAQALMTHFERRGSRSPAGATDGRFGVYFQQKGQYRAEPALDDNDTGLPQEWIY